MTGARGARWTGTGRGGCNNPLKLREVSAPRLGRAYRPDAPAKSQEALARSRASGTTTPLGKSRGGTPTGELPQKGRAAPDGAEDTDQRLSAFRFLDLFGEWGEADEKTETPPLCFGSQAQGSRATWLEFTKLGRRCATRTRLLCFTLPCRGRVAPEGRGVGLWAAKKNSTCRPRAAHLPPPAAPSARRPPPCRGRCRVRGCGPDPSPVCGLCEAEQPSPARGGGGRGCAARTARAAPATERPPPHSLHERPNCASPSSR